MNKIAFLSHPYHRGGVTRWMADAAEEFLNQNFEVFFITINPEKEFVSGKNRPTMVSLLSRKRKSFTLISPKHGYTFEFGTQEFRTNAYVQAILNGVPPNVPIIVSDDSAVWEAAAQCSWRNPMIGVLHSDDPHYYDLFRKYSKQVTTFVSVSNRIVENCRKQSGNFSDFIPVIPCGVPLQKDIRFEDKQGSDRISLIWAGRVEEHQKRVSDLIKISVELRKQNIPFHLDVIGHGSESDWFKKQIDSNELHNIITVHGWLPTSDIFSKMRTSDFLLLTSNYEGMPVAAMEALSNGCGVISSRVSGIEDLENHPLAIGIIWIFEIGNILQATEFITDAIKTSVSERRKTALKIAESEFSIQSSTKKYISVLSEIKFAARQKQSLTKFGTKQKIYSCLIATLRFIKINLIAFIKSKS